MLVTLRIVFTIIAALCIAAIFPVGTLLHWVWAVALAIAAGIFVALMLFCKRKQENMERQENPTPDFFSPQENDKE